jgi:hypothetical protein
LVGVPRPVHVAPHRYLIVVQRPWPETPLVERRWCLVVVPRPMPVAPRRYLIVVPRGGAQVLNRGAQAVARGAARCVSLIFDLCARPLPAAPLVVRWRYLVVV